MAIRFKCEHCHKPLAVKDNLAGKRAACPACKKPIAIPAPMAAPADLEDFAAAALRDQPTEPQEVKPPEYVEFECPMCGDPVKLDIALAGKNAQCPQCKNIVKVPLPKADKPKDWRDIGKKGPTAALMNLPEQLDGAWGTELKGRVGREALEDAGAVPVVEVERLGWGGWIRRGVIATAVLGVVTVIVISAKNNRSIKAVQNVFAEAREWCKEQEATKDPKKIPHPVLKAQIELAYGLAQLRLGKAEEARQRLMVARAIMNECDKESLVDHDLFLIELARAQMQLGKENEDEFRAKARFDWDRVRTEMLQSLNQIKADQAKIIAVRDLSSELIARDQVSSAIGLATGLSNASGGQDAKTSSLLPQVTALVFAKGDDKAVNNLTIKPPDPKKALDLAARLAYAEGFARKGDLDEAKRLVQLAGLDVNKFDAAVGVACVLLGNKSNKNAAAQAAPFVAYALELHAKGKGSSAWQVLQMCRTAYRLPDHAAEAKQRAAKLEKVFKRRAQLDWVEAQLEKGDAKLADLLPHLPDPEGPARGLAWMALGRYFGNSLTLPDAGSEDGPYIVFAKIGQALGAKDASK